MSTVYEEYLGISDYEVRKKLVVAVVNPTAGGNVFLDFDDGEFDMEVYPVYDREKVDLVLAELRKKGKLTIDQKDGIHVYTIGCRRFYKWIRQCCRSCRHWCEWALTVSFFGMDLMMAEPDFSCFLHFHNIPPWLKCLTYSQMEFFLV
jgi:hypothetical protein